MKQQSYIIVYRLPTKENKPLFSVSVCSKPNGSWSFTFYVCSKQTEVAVFR
jgi:hypothetical protein